MRQPRSGFPALRLRVQSARGITWDGQQLVIAVRWTALAMRSGHWPETPTGPTHRAMRAMSGDLPSNLRPASNLGLPGTASSLSSSTPAGDEIWTLARNADGTYTPGNAVQPGSFLPSVLTAVQQGMTWDGQQLVIVDNLNGDEIWTLARNADGTYTPGNAANCQGDLPSGPYRLRNWDDLGRPAACHRRQLEAAMRSGHWPETLTGPTHRAMRRKPRVLPFQSLSPIQLKG